MAIMLISLVNAAVLSAQPMEKPAGQLYSSVNMKPVANDMAPSFNLEVVPTRDSSKVIVRIINPEKKKLHISIRGYGGEVYSQNTNEEEFLKRFDFSKVENGTYTFIVAAGKKKLRKQININTFTEYITHKMEITEAEEE